MKHLFMLFFILLLSSSFGQITGMEDMFGTDTSPVALDTLTNIDSTQTRTILFERPDLMGGSVSVSGKIKLLSGSSVTIIPKFTRVYKKYPSKLGPWHTMTAITTSDSTKYELNISGDSNWQFGWGYAVRYIVSSGTHSTEIEAVGSHR